MNRLIAIPFLFLVLSHITASVLADELVEDFEKLAPGDPPDALFIIDGEFQVVAHEGGKVLRLPAAPLLECGLLFGKSSKGSMTAEAKVLALKKGRRSFPRFGLGVHGISGYRIRAVPAQKRLELVYQEEVVKTAPLVWESGKWCTLKLALIQEEGKAPKVEAWCWTEGSESPSKPSLVYEGEEGGASGQGKASVWGTPYSGKEILFDDLKVTWTPAKK